MTAKNPANSMNDIDLEHWRDHPDIITDSLWLFPQRSDSGAHSAEYWGNFIPQIITQAMLRFTRRGEVVLDGFLGSGTTLIECRRQGRYGVGIELVPEVRKRAGELVDAEPDAHHILTRIIGGDSRLKTTANKAGKALVECGREQAQLLVLHPPYHDIIRFSDLKGDLSNAPTEAGFYRDFSRVVANLSPLLQPGRYLMLVIGDKYQDSEWVPLGFRTMECVLKQGYRLKSICVKDIHENRGKRNQQNLWRYRALRGGYYIFKHEYIMFFQKI
jgi:DNA methylase